MFVFCYKSYLFIELKTVFPLHFSLSKLAVINFILNRPGRKPLGFLSLICKKSSPDVGEDSKGNKEKFQKPQIPASKRSLKRSAPSTEDEGQTLEPCSLPSTSTSFAEGENTAAAIVKVHMATFNHLCILCER